MEREEEECLVSCASRARCRELQCRRLDVAMLAPQLEIETRGEREDMEEGRRMA